MLGTAPFTDATCDASVSPRQGGPCPSAASQSRGSRRSRPGPRLPGPCMSHGAFLLPGTHSMSLAAKHLAGNRTGELGLSEAAPGAGSEHRPPCPSAKPAGAAAPACPKPSWRGVRMSARPGTASVTARCDPER